MEEWMVSIITSLQAKKVTFNYIIHYNYDLELKITSVKVEKILLDLNYKKM